MFELSVACKYLIPRWRQLSVSIISLISILVISLVVWLILVFFSVANGLEKNWIEKLVAMTAPIRVTPTEEYYRSYYYNIDSISESSSYTSKTIAEKQVSSMTDPYDPATDETIPSYWPAPDLNSQGELKDLVKEAFQAIDQIPQVTASDFEMAMGNIRLRTSRKGKKGEFGFMNQSAFFGSLDPSNALLKKNLIPIDERDLSNLLEMLILSSDNILEESPQMVGFASPEELRKRLKIFFKYIKITHLKTPAEGWLVPRKLLPDTATLKTLAVLKDSEIIEIILLTGKENKKELNEKYLPLGYRLEPAKLFVAKPHMNLELIAKESLVNVRHIPLVLSGGYEFNAAFDSSSLDTFQRLEELQFHVEILLQNSSLKGVVPYRTLTLSGAQVIDRFEEKLEQEPFWLYEIASKDEPSVIKLPLDHTIGEGVMLPKTFREGGVLLGDMGFISYHIATASSIQEQRIPIYVAGFYDHGIIPIGGKCILVSNAITSAIRSTYSQGDQFLNTGINLRFEEMSRAEQMKSQLMQIFKEKGIDQYWKIQTFREFDFTRDILQQIRSEKHLFSLIAGVIIIVACSNIISMLIILVNDKKMEIGILRAMGATSTSIGLIFGLCGMIMGLIGSVIGMALAFITLKNIDSLMGLIGKLQGYEVFNVMFYGDTLPNELSSEALLFVLVSTAITSILAGIIPAVKASMVHPSEILRCA